MKFLSQPQMSTCGGGHSSSSSSSGSSSSLNNPNLSHKHSLKTHSLAPISTSGPRSTHSSTSSEPDDDQSPPISPLRSPMLSSSNSSISSSGWGFSSTSQRTGSQLSMFEDGDSNGSSSSLCNSKEDRATYNTKFAKYHLETYRQNDRMRWNFDFDHNRPLDDSHHHHHQSVPRYQWEPAI